MMRFSFVPEVSDYTNLKHMKVNLEFPTITGDESPLEMLMMFKQFLRLMNYSEEQIAKLVHSEEPPYFFENGQEYVPPTEEECEEMAQFAIVEDLVQAHEEIMKDYEKNMDEVQEIVEENEEHRS